MATRSATRQARETLDRRLVPMQPATQYAPPRLGWIRAIRDALGMSAAELATRMGISGASVRSLEQKEMSGGIRLSSLQRAAQAMDCTLVYAFVPNTTLDETVRRQARRVLDEQIGRTRQTMALEAQQGDMRSSAVDSQLQAIIDSARLWSGRGAKQ